MIRLIFQIVIEAATLAHISYKNGYLSQNVERRGSGDINTRSNVNQSVSSLIVKPDGFLYVRTRNWPNWSTERICADLIINNTVSIRCPS